MTPRMSNIGASIRKMFSGIGGDGDYYWDNTVLAIPFDGDNNQTTFTDYKGKALSRGGSAVLSTAEKVFGKSSLYLPGSGSYVSAAVSTDFNFGTGDFTVEAWIKMSERATSAVVIDYFKAGTSEWQVLVNKDGYPSLYEPNPNLYALTGNIKVNDNQWHHIQFNRYGTQLMCFVDGEICGQATNTKNYIAGADMLAIGAQMSTRNATYDFIGYIDEVRITKGVARNRCSYKLPGLPMANF